MAPARIRWDRLPIIPLVRWCRYRSRPGSVPGWWRCSRSAASMVATRPVHSCWQGNGPVAASTHRPAICLPRTPVNSPERSTLIPA